MRKLLKCSFCTRLTDSSPPATMIGTWSTITRWAAMAIACRPEEQKRLTVTPAVVTGSPARSADCRAMFCPVAPSGNAQPRITSSTSPGSTRARSTAALMTWPAIVAPDVLDVRHLHADFFLHLAGDGAFQRLAVVDEAGDQRVAPGRPDGFAGQQHALAVAHEDDHARVQVRIMLVLALRAALAPFALDARGPLAAAGTVSAGRFPPERLHGHAAEREQIVGKLGALHRDARLAVIAGRQRVPARHGNHPARLAA